MSEFDLEDEQWTALNAEVQRLREQAEWLMTECRCPDCRCATPEDAERNECGCDSPVCQRDGGISLAQHFATLKARHDRLVALIQDRGAMRIAILTFMQLNGGGDLIRAHDDQFNWKLADALAAHLLREEPTP